MENNEVFEAEATVDKSQRLSAGSTGQLLHGQEAATATAAIPPESYADEENPLLFRSTSGESWPEPADADRDDNIIPPPWEGAGQYDGLPWWRTPSVCGSNPQ